MHFAERYFELFHYVLEVARRHSGAEAEAPDFQSVRQNLDRLLQEEEKAPLPQGYSREDRLEGLWPVLAWADELLLNAHSEGRGWQAFSLQRDILKTNQGGSLFFDRLEDLLHRRLSQMSGRSTLGASPPQKKGPKDAAPAPPPGGAPGAHSQPLPPPGSSWPGASGGPGYAGAAAFDLSPFPEGGQPPAQVDPAAASDAVLSWHSPGAGPEPLEGILDVYALALILGFQGRLLASPSDAQPVGAPSQLAAEPGPDPSSEGSPRVLPGAERVLAELKDLSIKQLRGWRDEPGPALQTARKRSLWRRISDYFWEYDWFFVYIVVPLAILGLLYLKSVRIILNLPF